MKSNQPNTGAEVASCIRSSSLILHERRRSNLTPTASSRDNHLWTSWLKWPIIPWGLKSQENGNQPSGFNSHRLSSLEHAKSQDLLHAGQPEAYLLVKLPLGLNHCHRHGQSQRPIQQQSSLQVGLFLWQYPGKGHETGDSCLPHVATYEGLFFWLDCTLYLM